MLGNKEYISNLVKEVFEDFGKISSIKPLLIEGTPYMTDQQIIIFDNTDDPELETRIPRFTSIEDNRVTTEWKEAPKICFFCDQTGHIKRNCEQFQEARNLRHYFQDLKNKNKQKEVATETSNEISTNLEQENPIAKTPTQKMSIETEPTQEQVINSEENSDENEIDTSIESLNLKDELIEIFQV